MPIIINYPQTETFTFSGTDTLVPAGSTLTFIAGSDIVSNTFTFNTTTTNADGSYSLTQTVPVGDLSFADFVAVFDPAQNNLLVSGLSGSVSEGGFSFADTVTVNPVVGTVTFSDTVDPTSAPVTKNDIVTPFAHFMLSDTNPTETISAGIQLTSSYSASGSTNVDGIIGISGTAAQVQAALDSFTAKALSNGPGKIILTLSGGNLNQGAGAGKVSPAFVFNGTAPGGSGLQSPTSAQITTLTNDTIQFYNDAQHVESTTDDATKMVNDLSGLSIDKPTLAQLLTAALQRAAGTNAGTLGSDLANVFYSSINGDTHSQSANLGNDLTSMIDETVAVGGTYNSLVGTESATKALAQTVSQYHLS